MIAESKIGEEHALELSTTFRLCSSQWLVGFVALPGCVLRFVQVSVRVHSKGTAPTFRAL